MPIMQNPGSSSHAWALPSWPTLRTFTRVISPRLPNRTTRIPAFAKRSNTVRPAARTLPPSPLTPFGEGDCGDAECSVCLQDHGRSPRMPKATPNYGLEMHPMASSGRRAKKDRCMRVINIFHAFCPVVCCCRGFPKWINVRIASGRSSRARMSSGHLDHSPPNNEGIVVLS
jgi:hypothetical protein